MHVCMLAQVLLLGQMFMVSNVCLCVYRSSGSSAFWSGASVQTVLMTRHTMQTIFNATAECTISTPFREALKK